MNRKDKIEALKRQLILHPSYLTIIEEIEKDLELLDIIKKKKKKGDIVVNPDLFVDYPELYEWLEQNEWNNTKSNKFNQCYKVIN